MLASVTADVAHPVAIHDRRRRLATGPPPGADNVGRPGDDAGRLLTLLGVFAVAMLVVVLAVLGAAAVDTWWALVLLMVLHGAMTAVAFAAVIFVFSGSLRRPRRAPADRRR